MQNSGKDLVASLALAGHLHAPALARAGVMAAAAASLFALVKIVLLLLAGPDLPVPALPSRSDGARAPDAALPLSAWHLFGVAQTQRSVAMQEASDSNLRLRGTITSAQVDRGIAIIADGEGRERAYPVGTQLPGGGVLAAVWPDHVTIARDGRDERLDLSLRPATSAATASAAAAVAPPARPDRSGGYLTGVLAFGAPDLASARTEQMPAWQALAAAANLLPVTENGHLLGVRIALPDPQPLRAFGLEPQDVITAVNGIPLDRPERQQALLASLGAGDRITLQVLRDGRERTISIGY